MADASLTFDTKIDTSKFSAGISAIATSSAQAFKTVGDNIQVAQAKIAQITNSIGDTKQKLSESAAATEKMKSAYDNLNGILQENQNRLAESKSGIEAQKNVMQENQKVVSDLKLKYETLKEALGSNAEATKQAKSAYEESKQTVNENKKAIEFLKIEYNSINSAVKDNKKELSDAAKEYSKTASETNTLQAKLNQLESEYSQQERALDQNKEALQDIRKEMGSEIWDTFKSKVSDIGDSVKTAGGKIADFSKKVGEITIEAGKVVAKGLAVTSTAFAGLSLKALELGGELEQNMGGAEAVFGEFADSVKEKSKTAFDTAGLAASDYLATVNKMGALMQGSGLDIETSMNLSTEAMQRAADVASIMGIDIDSAMESIAGAAKGNFTMMDNLGVAMNATTIEAYAMSKGITTAYKDMDNAQKVTLAMEMFLEKTTYATGNYAKENETLAGSLATAKAAVSNFLSGAGDTESVVDALKNATGVIIENLKELLPRLSTGLGEIIQMLIPEIPSAMRSLLPSIVQGGAILLDGLMVVLSELPSLIAEMFPVILNAMITLVNRVISSVPSIITNLASSVMNILNTSLKQQIPTLGTAIQSIVDAFKNIGTSVIQSGLLQNVSKLLMKIGEEAIKIAPSVAKIFSNTVVSLIKSVSGVLDFLADNFDTILSLLPKLILGFATFKTVISIAPMIESVGNMLTLLGDNILNATIKMASFNTAVGASGLSGAIASLSAGMSGAITSIKLFGQQLWTTIASHPILLAVSAFTALATVVGVTLYSNWKKTQEEIAKKQIEERFKGVAATVDDLRGALDSISGSFDSINSRIDSHKSTLESLNSEYDNAANKTEQLFGVYRANGELVGKEAENLKDSIIGASDSVVRKIEEDTDYQYQLYKESYEKSGGVIDEEEQKMLDAIASRGQEKKLKVQGINDEIEEIYKVAAENTTEGAVQLTNDQIAEVERLYSELNAIADRERKIQSEIRKQGELDFLRDIESGAINVKDNYLEILTEIETSEKESLQAARDRKNELLAINEVNFEEGIISLEDYTEETKKANTTYAEEVNGIVVSHNTLREAMKSGSSMEGIDEYLKMEETTKRANELKTEISSLFELKAAFESFDPIKAQEKADEISALTEELSGLEGQLQEMPEVEFDGIKWKFEPDAGLELAAEIHGVIDEAQQSSFETAAALGEGTAEKYVAGTKTSLEANREEIKNSYKGISEDVATELESGFSEALDATTSFNDRMAATVQQMPEHAGKSIMDLVKEFSKMPSELDSTLGQTKATISEKMAETGNISEEKGMEVPKMFSEGVEGSSSEAIQAANTMIEDTSQAINDNDSLNMSMKETIISAWESAVAQVKASNFVEIGMQIVQGMANGISNNSGILMSAAQRMIDGVKNLIKGPTGVDSHSPSRWAMQIGKYVDEGMANGITDNMKLVEHATQGLVDEFKATAEERINIEIDVLDEILKRNDENYKQLKRFNDIAAKEQAIADAKDAKTREKLQRELSEMKEKFSIEDLKNYKKALEEQKKATEEHNKAIFDHSKNWIEKRKFYGQLSTEEEVAAWQRVTERFAEGTDQREEAERQLYTAQKKLYEENYNNAKKWIDTRKFYGELSMKEELEALEFMQTQYAEGTKEREELDKNYFTLKKNMADEEEKIIKKIADTEQGYLDKLESKTYSIMKAFGGIFSELTEKEDKRQTELKNAQKSYDDVSKSIDDLNKQLQEAIENDKEIASIEEKISEKQTERAEATTRLSKAQTEANKSQMQILTENLTGQLDVMEKYSSDIQTIMSKGVLSDELLEELKAMGPGAYQEISAFASATDSELKEYNDKWVKLFNISEMLATEDSDIQKARQDTEDALNGYNKDLENLVADHGYDIGKMFVEEYSSGMSDSLKNMKSIGSELIEAGEITVDTGNLQVIGTDLQQVIKQSVEESGDAIYETSELIINQLITGMEEQFEEFKIFANTVYTELRSRFDEQPWRNLGYNMIMGMVKGIMEALQPLIEAVIAAIKAALAAGEAELGVASPAKKVIPTGVNWILGYVEGIKKASPELTAALTEAIDLGMDLASYKISDSTLSAALPTNLSYKAELSQNLSGNAPTIVNHNYYIYPKNLTYTDKNQFIGELSRMLAKSGV